MHKYAQRTQALVCVHQLAPTTPHVRSWSLTIEHACFVLGLVLGDLEQKWLGNVVRICLGIVGTFWITIARTLYVPQHSLFFES